MANVKLRALDKSYGHVKVIHGIDIDIAHGEFVALVGPSGCGKSTLLRMIAGLEQISGGEVAIGGQVVNDVPPKHRDIAMVFQNYALYPHMTVRGNMGFALKLAGVAPEQAESRIARAAGILGLSDLLDRFPRQLSGGQRQRVAMGRAIVRDPEVFLFDEPLSNLDAALRVQMRIELAQLHQRLGATMIYVTHDQTEAMTLASKIAVLNLGRLEQVASPIDLYNRPRNLFVARFIGSPQMNILPGRVAALAKDSIVVALPDGAMLSVPGQSSRLKTGDAVQVGLRPEALIPTEAGALGGSVRLVEHLGGLTLLHVGNNGGPTLTVQTAGNNATRVGETIRLDANPAGLHLFDPDGLRIAGEIA